MASIITRVGRRLVFGQPIVVVSGLPRSGTSMAMKMLDAAGLEILTDGRRQPDISNPKGYYEFEPVEKLGRESDTAWVRAARGRVVKVVSPLLRHLPRGHNYRVIFMRRELAEIIASQDKMLAQRGEAVGTQAPEALERIYQDHLWKARYLLTRHACFSLLEVDYAEVLQEPHAQAHRISEFLGGSLDVGRMAEVVDPALYRNRAEGRAKV